MNKRIAPTVVVAFLVIAILGQTGAVIYALSREGLSVLWQILIIAAPLLVIAALIAVYIERLQEIRREEEEGDLDRY